MAKIIKSATYSIFDNGLLQNHVCFYINHDNGPMAAALKFSQMIKVYQSSFMTYTAAFVRANHDAEFARSHEKEERAYQYTLTPSEEGGIGEEFFLTAQTVTWKRKSKANADIVTFFEGTIEDFIEKYAAEG